MKKSSLQSELGFQTSEVAHLKAREAQLTVEVMGLRESKRIIDEELHKLKTQHSVDNLQMKELQDQFEAENFFSVNYFSSISVTDVPWDKPSTKVNC